MLFYFLVFLSIGVALARLSSRNVAFGYMLFISAFWGFRSELLWGLAALGELSLGYFVGLTIFGSKDGDSSTAKMSPQERLKLHLRSSMHDQQIDRQLTESTQGKALLGLFQEKVLSVLNNEFNYFPDVNGFQRDVFTRVTTGAIQLDINEYDAAIGFILLQLKSLTRPLSATVIDFYAEKLGVCIRLAPKSKGGLALIEIFVVDHKSDFDEKISARPELSLAVDILRNQNKGFHSPMAEIGLNEEASKEVARMKFMVAPAEGAHISPSGAPSKDPQSASNVWSKALRDSLGDEQEAKALYIRNKIQSIREEAETLKGGIPRSTVHNVLRENKPPEEPHRAGAELPKQPIELSTLVDMLAESLDAQGQEDYASCLIENLRSNGFDNETIEILVEDRLGSKGLDLLWRQPGFSKN